MHRLFTRMTARYAVPMNREVMDGIAVGAVKHMEEYLDAQLRSVCASFPPSVTYDGYEPCTTQEEYEEITRPRSNRRTFDLAKSTLNLMKYYFTFTDMDGVMHRITRYIYLPYVLPAGIIYLGGTRYHLVPVLSDKVFTPSRGTIFVRLQRDRNIMRRTYHTVVIDGRPETRYVVWSMIHRMKKNPGVRVTTKALTTLPHYLFAKYGFSEAFKRFTGIVPVVGGTEISEENYPKDEWIIYKSTGVPPNGFISKPYARHSVRLAIRREQWSKAIEGMIVAFFYVADNFPTRFRPDASILDRPSEWMILIGHIVFSGEYGDGRLYMDIQEHLESLDSYLDTVVKDKLAERGIFLNDYYDMLYYINSNFDEMLQEKQGRGQEVYGKNLEVLYYLLYDIISGFVKVNFELKKAEKRRNNNITLKDVTENFNRYVPTGKIFSLSSGKIVATPVNYSGDHKYPKITAVLAEQESQVGAGRQQNNRVVVGPQHRIDLSMVTLGSILNLPKPTPTPIARLNMWAPLEGCTYTVVESLKYKELIDANRKWFTY